MKVVTLILVIITLILLIMFNHKNYTTVATCDNGFTKEAESLYTDKGLIKWSSPTTVYKIPEGVTCVITHKRLDNKSSY
jgi:hypothetical protein